MPHRIENKQKHLFHFLEDLPICFEFATQDFQSLTYSAAPNEGNQHVALESNRVVAKWRSCNKYFLISMTKSTRLDIEAEK